MHRSSARSAKAPRQARVARRAAPVRRAPVQRRVATVPRRTMTVAPAGTVPFKPIANRVLLKKEPVEKPKSAAGLILPASQNKNANTVATVIAVGPGLRTNEGRYVPTFVRPGDQVLLPEFGGSEVKFNDQSYHIYRDDDLLGVITAESLAERSANNI